MQNNTVQGDIYRCVYLGSTSLNTHVYLGEDSAKFARFVYAQVGIELILHKTDIVLTTQEYAHLAKIQATTFKNTHDIVMITQDIKTIMEAYDVCLKYGFKPKDVKPCNNYSDVSVSTSENENGDDTRKFYVKYMEIFRDTRCDIVLYNIQENITAFLSNTQELPEFKDNILSYMEWKVVEYLPEQLDKVVDGEDGLIVRNVLAKLFHKKQYKSYMALTKKLCAFEDLYIN